MKCPHCLVEFHPEVIRESLNNDSDGRWYVEVIQCANPFCHKNIVTLVNGNYTRSNGIVYPIKSEIIKKILVYPKGTLRPPVPVEVTKDIAEDYTEACLVIEDSAKASAALSRRCLQNLLKEKAGVTKHDLADQIQEVIDSGKLPSQISENIDAIRHIGNYAAHPNKSKSTGEILKVEPHEAEWNLEALEQLFDFYFVQPAKAKLRRDALNAKLADAGKPPLKT